MLRMKLSSLLLLLLGPLAAPSIGQGLAPPMLSSSASDSATQANQMGPPMSFEVNCGQARQGIDFVAHGRGYSSYLSAGRATLHLNRLGSSRAALVKAPVDVEVGIDLMNASPHPELRPEDKLPGRSNYLLGTDPSKWITEVMQYGKVRYRNVYPGIDVVYYGNQSRLEHDFVVHPGTDAGQIRLAFSGVQRTEWNSSGELVLHVSAGELRLKKPRAYQVIERREVDVPSEYILRHRQVRFRVGPHDPNQTLIIDPVLVYSTFLGGPPGSAGSSQGASAIAVDGAGNVYVAGVTTSTSFPLTPGALSSTPAPFPQYAGFVSKLDSTGAKLLYSTYVSGLRPTALLVDPSGTFTC